MRWDKDKTQPYLYGSDTNYYFAWGRSLAVDGDIDFRNDFEFLANWSGGLETQSAFAKLVADPPLTPIGRISNKYGIGFGLLSLPLISLSRGAARLVSSLSGKSISRFAAVYPLAFIWTSILIGFAGLAGAHSLISTRCGRKAATLAIVIAMLGLSLGFYIWFEPAMAHAPTFALSVTFILLALRWNEAIRNSPISGGAIPCASSVQPAPLSTAGRPSSERQVSGAAFVMGIALGACCMVRFTSVAFAIVPLVLAMRHRKTFKPGHRWKSAAITSLAAYAAGIIVGFLPQMIAWKCLYGSWLIYSYRGETVHYFPVNALRVLFGSVNGLFIWTPLALCAVAGLAWLARRGDELASAGCAVLLGLLWIYGCWDEYTLGDSFGMRGFVDGGIFLVLGLGGFVAAIHSIRMQLLKRTVIAAIILLVVWNVYFIECYRANIQKHSAPFAGLTLFSQPHQWFKQFAKDVNLPKRLLQRKFPLFTPANQ